MKVLSPVQRLAALNWGIFCFLGLPFLRAMLPVTSDSSLVYMEVISLVQRSAALNQGMFFRVAIPLGS